MVVMNAQTRMALAETADIEIASDSYAQRFSGKVGTWFLEVQEEATLKMLAPYPGATILDVGGGHGQLTGALVENNFDLTVLGSDESCRARISQYLETYRCTFEVGDILDLPYPDQSFGVVVSFRLLPHVTLWEQYIHELARVAEKAVIIDYADVRSFGHFAPSLLGRDKRQASNGHTYTTFRQREVLDAFRANGFIPGGKFTEFFLPMSLHRKANLPRLSQIMESFCRGLGLTNSFGSPTILKLIREEPLS